MLKDRVEKEPEMKKYFSPSAKSFLEAILEVDPEKRLGGFEEGS